MGKSGPQKFNSAAKNRSSKKQRPKTDPHVRLMAPFAMICSECSAAIYKSTKFNARKRPTTKTYLGIKILNFEIRCPQCSQPICFETDPKTSGYVLVQGARRLLDLQRDKQAEAETAEEKIKRISTVEQQDKLEKLATGAELNLEQAARDREVDELQRLVQARRQGKR